MDIPMLMLGIILAGLGAFLFIASLIDFIKTFKK